MEILNCEFAPAEQLIVTEHKGEGSTALSDGMVASWLSQASFNPPGFTVAVAKDRSLESLLHMLEVFTLNRAGKRADEAAPAAITAKSLSAAGAGASDKPRAHASPCSRKGRRR